MRTLFTPYVILVRTITGPSSVQNFPAHLIMEMIQNINIVAFPAMLILGSCRPPRAGSRRIGVAGPFTYCR